MPRTPACSHLNTPFALSLEKAFTLRNNTQEYPKVYNQTHIFIKGNKGLSTPLSQVQVQHGDKCEHNDRFV